jgi:hypothetical protein
MSDLYKNIIITGTPGALAKISITNAAGNTYDETTQTFTSSPTTVDRTIDTGGFSNVQILLPEPSTDDTYDYELKTVAGIQIGDKNDKYKQINPGVSFSQFKDYLTKTLTFDTNHTTAGHTIASTLDATFKGSPETASYEDVETESLLTFTLSGAVTKSSALLYTSRQPTWNVSTGGDFSNAYYSTAKVLKFNQSTRKIVVDSDTNITNGDTVFGENIDEEMTITKDGSNIITINAGPKFPRLEIDETLHFSKSGYIITINDATVAGSGTTSLTASVTAEVERFGYDDMTVQWALNNFVSTTPNASDISVTCTAGEIVTIDCGTGDTDANASSKTYSRVAGPSRGTVGNNSTSFNNNTFTGSTITYKNTSGAGEDTDTFTFKCNDGTTDSATKTVTITLTE